MQNNSTKKLFILIYLLLYMGAYYFYLSNNYAPKLLLYEMRIFIIPLYNIILIFLFLHSNQKRGFAVLTFVYITVILSLVLYIFIGFVVPKLLLDTQLTKREAEKNINTAYEYAVRVNDQVEAQSYIKLYNNQSNLFLGINNLSMKNVDLFGITDINKKLELIDMNTSIQKNLITDNHVRNMDKDNLLFKIQNYLSENNFSSAKILLVYYKKIYGNDTNYESLINRLQQLTNFESSFFNTSSKNYYSELEYFYSIIKQDNISADEVVLANNMFSAYISGMIVSEYPELQWIEEQLKLKLYEYVFFTGDARKYLLELTQPIPLVFVENLKNKYILWTATNASYIKEINTIYIKDLELVAISKETKSIAWHIKTDYAKLEGNKLFLNSIERNSISLHSYFEEVVNYTSEDILPIMNVSIPTKRVATLRPDSLVVNQANFIELWNMYPAWKIGLLPLSLVFERILHIGGLVILFLVCGMLIVRWIYISKLNPSTIDRHTSLATILIAGIIPLQLITSAILRLLLQIIPVDWLLYTSMSVLVGFLLIIIVLINDILQKVKIDTSRKSRVRVRRLSRRNDEEEETSEETAEEA